MSLYLKWENETIGIIDEDSHEVALTCPSLNLAVQSIFQGKTHLSVCEWKSFLEDRIVSDGRRDINKILYHCGLNYYDPFRIARYTRALNLKDKCWIAYQQDEEYEAVFHSVFNEKLLSHQSSNKIYVNSPNGQHIKKYGQYHGKLGIFKERINAFSTDVQSEVAVYLLAQKMGISCCPATQFDEKTVFSEFLYDFRKESIIHFRNLFPVEYSSKTLVENFLTIRPQYETELFQMVLIDFITHQDDRHLSNFAIKISGNTESFYPLYDNGNSLFYLDPEDLVQEKCSDPILYCNTLGPIGTQWDALTDLLAKNPRLINTVNLDINDTEISAILKEANFKDYRHDGAKEWIRKTLDLVKEQFLLRGTSGLPDYYVF